MITCSPPCKKDAGVYPIAIGCPLHHIEAKVASRAVLELIGSLLAPVQLQFAVTCMEQKQQPTPAAYFHHLFPDHVLQECIQQC